MSHIPLSEASSDWRIVSGGDRCVIIAFGDRVDIATSLRVQAAAAHFLAHPLNGVTDVVPAFTTLALHYDPSAYAPDDAPFDVLSGAIDAALRAGLPEMNTVGRTIEIPVCYDGTFAPDIDDVAARCGIDRDEVIARHGASELIVCTFFFSPGTPFAVGLDPTLSVPRRKTPRTRVPKGSVAIANNQATVYTLETPGGWSIIGRTPMRFFDLAQTPPVRLRLGDRIRFVPISQADYAAYESGAQSWA